MAAVGGTNAAQFEQRRCHLLNQDPQLGADGFGFRIETFDPSC
jgi:hypothetical protein